MLLKSKEIQNDFFLDLKKNVHYVWHSPTQNGQNEVISIKTL